MRAAIAISARVEAATTDIERRCAAVDDDRVAIVLDVLTAIHRIDAAAGHREGVVATADQKAGSRLTERYLAARQRDSVRAVNDIDAGRVLCGRDKAAIQLHAARAAVELDAIAINLRGNRAAGKVQRIHAICDLDGGGIGCAAIADSAYYGAARVVERDVLTIDAGIADVDDALRCGFTRIAAGDGAAVVNCHAGGTVRADAVTAGAGMTVQIRVVCRGSAGVAAVTGSDRVGIGDGAGALNDDTRSATAAAAAATRLIGRAVVR